MIKNYLSYLRLVWLNKHHIINAFLKRIFSGNKTKQIAEQRLSICESCEFNSKNIKDDDSTLKSFLKLPYNHCTICSCHLKLKVFSKEGSCPKDKW